MSIVVYVSEHITSPGEPWRISRSRYAISASGQCIGSAPRVHRKRPLRCTADITGPVHDFAPREGCCRDGGGMPQSRVTASQVAYFFPSGGASEEGQRSVNPAAAHSPNPCVALARYHGPTSGYSPRDGTLAVHPLYTEPPALSVQSGPPRAPR
jgi:hypothetical protein